MGRPAGWTAALTGRSPMKSPGAPALRREVERQFRREIAKGLLAEEAAAAVGVSQAAGCRWFRHGGGMPPMDPALQSGRYLSFHEREEIAVLKAQGAGVRDTARRLGREPSTISRELRRYDVILHAISEEPSNGLIESTNTKTRLIIRRGSGFRSADAVIALVMLCLGANRPTCPAANSPDHNRRSSRRV